MTQGRRVSPALPYIIFAGVNIVVGVLCLFLPETNGIHLPATVDEALDMEKWYKIKFLFFFQRLSFWFNWLFIPSFI